MKKLIIINGTMGVGKSSVCKKLLEKLTPGVWLDGDWCWNMNPFIVTEENKEMVEDNICYLLRSFLNNSGYEYVIFCWVIHEEYIFEQLLSRLKGIEFKLYKITLICTEQVLVEHIQKDIEIGGRKQEDIDRSAARLPLYLSMDTTKIDISNLTIEQTADAIKQLVTTKKL
ncbi:AAA family ATPase [Anaerocolumna sp. MB42-C2]|uniref:AAA family ATPase n=1 Tax=Anaerocolumna sp. MB42-C2 TaxID=3070997 RepID=UPI0027DED607|nr:AAA family ATPase [Anaerocolumna sp. MB42-C2]WMJ89011.1 AAA family ATPase [Anaerocolumna sp. MB42-C2]